MSASADPAGRGGCPTADELVAFGDGRLPDGALEAVAAHIEGCAGCRAFLGTLDDRADPLVEELRRPVPAGLIPAGDDTAALPEKHPAGLPQWAGRLGLLFEARRATAVTQVPGAAPAVTALPCVPGYDLLGELGWGGMGVVYRARQAGPKRLGGLKMIRAG